MKRFLPVLLLFCIHCSQSKAQTVKKIVILGSSTAAGTVSGGGLASEAWAARLQASFRLNTGDNADTAIENLAYPGFVSYNLMPNTNYTPPANRTGWPVDPARNVNAAIASAPAIVIISLPTNDAELPGFVPSELMGNLRLMYSRITAANIKCFITTTQPRTPYNSTLRLYLRQLRDSILNTFAQYSLNFWDDLVNPVDTTYQAALTGDGVHPNAAGHLLLFNRVVAKNIFAVTGTIILPVKLSRFQAHNVGSTVALSWHTDEEEPQTSFEIERSGDGRSYESIGRVLATGSQGSADYSYTDQRPLNSQAFYRLKIVEPSKLAYSPVVRVLSDRKSLSINKMTVNNTALNLDLSSQKKQRITISIISAEGKQVRSTFYDLTPNGNSVKLPVDYLARGQYFIRLSTVDGSTLTERFVKL